MAILERARACASRRRKRWRVLPDVDGDGGVPGVGDGGGAPGGVPAGGDGGGVGIDIDIGVEKRTRR
jgi:hypothetical protein